MTRKLFLLAPLAAFALACGSKNQPNAAATANTTVTAPAHESAPAPAPKTINYTGTYRDGDLKDEESGYQELLVWSLPDNKIKVALTVQNGAPGFHSGFIDGEIVVQNNVASIETKEYGESCKIVLTFTDKDVKIDQVEGGDADCGFGQGVMAGGTLPKVDSAAPKEADK